MLTNIGFILTLTKVSVNHNQAIVLNFDFVNPEKWIYKFVSVCLYECPTK